MCGEPQNERGDEIRPRLEMLNKPDKSGHRKEALWLNNVPASCATSEIARRELLLAFSLAVWR